MTKTLNGWIPAEEAGVVTDSRNFYTSSLPNFSSTIIALTAGTVKGERDRCLQVGMDDYLSKPFVLDTLHSTREPWVERSTVGVEQ